MNWHEAKPALARLAAAPRLGLMLDLDGTVSHQHPDPMAARITARSLAALEALYPCLTLLAFISGRAAEDLQKRVGMAEVLYIGSHGLEHLHQGQLEQHPGAAEYHPHFEAMIRELEPFMQPGMSFEHKHGTISLHYRAAADPAEIALGLRGPVQEMAAERGLEFFEGNHLFELRAPLRVNKGTAFSLLVERYELQGAIMAGDDITDTDAFKVARQMRQEGRCEAYALGVQSAYMPTAVREHADFLAAGVEGIEDFLEWLAQARQAANLCP